MTYKFNYKKTFTKIILISLIYIVNLSHPLNAKIASVIGDPISQEIYFKINEHTKNYPASLTKLMTLYIIFEEIKFGRLKIDDKLSFSNKALSQQPSKLNISKDTSITIDEAIDAIIIKSANDVALAVAEKISGNEKTFIKKMNLYAKNFKLKNTNFANPHGLPNKANLSSAYDMFILSSKIIKDYPHFLDRFNKTSVKIEGKTYNTHNKLVKKYKKYIGMKTGYIRKSGFQISLLSANNGNYLLGIYFGGNSAKERDNKINFLMNKFSDVNKSSKKLISQNENTSKKLFMIQTSSFKKISLSKKHILFLKNKLDFLNNYKHNIKKTGNYFTSYIILNEESLANSLCNKIKSKDLDCFVKTM